MDHNRIGYSFFAFSIGPYGNMWNLDPRVYNLKMEKNKSYKFFDLSTHPTGPCPASQSRVGKSSIFLIFSWNLD